MITQFPPGQHILFSQTGETYEILAQEGVFVSAKNSQTGYPRNFTLIEINYQNPQLSPISQTTNS